MTFLWPLLCFLNACAFHLWPLHMLMLWSCFKILRSVHSWWKHFQLANLISQWHRSELQLKMKRAGIKPRWAPIAPPLGALPSNLVVLSCVMLLMSRVGLDPFVTPIPPVTWVEALGRVRDLHSSLPFTQPPPPEPPPAPPPAPPVPPALLDPAGVGEGDDAHECADACCPHLQCLDSAALNELMTCEFIHGPNLSNNLHLMEETTDSLEDHVATGLFACWSCHLSRWPFSFGPLGLLAGAGPDSTVIIDTGASLCVTPHKSDFVSHESLSGRVMKGLTKGAHVAGVGVLRWQIEVGGAIVNLNLRGLHVPDSTVRLLPPQQLKQEHSLNIGKIEVLDNCVRIAFPEGVLDCHLNESNLPVTRLTVPNDAEENAKALHACVMAETNQNLTPAQKELLRWHSKFAHMDLKRVQQVLKAGSVGWSPLVKAAANIDLNKTPLVCASCAYAKAKRKASRPKRTRAPTHSTTNDKEKLLSKDVLIPGQKVSMDHFIVSTPGRLFSSRGSESHEKMHKGGVIFKDHASSHVVVEPVVNFTVGEALRAKKSYEREMASLGVTVINCHTDNGVFTAAAFQDKLAELGQGLSLSGVGAHHQNAVAEREIGIVFSLARTMMLHAKLRWPKAVTAKLWPMVLKHTQHLVNHIPGANNICPMDLVLGSKVPRDHLKNLHVWGAPAYVLHPKLQDGGKIPKWDPRSRQGLHLGWSPLHASTVPLILNLETGHVSPQFHVLFDDWFTTVSTDDKGVEDIEGETWSKLLAEDRFLAHFDDDDPIELDDEWLSDLERHEKHQKAAARVQSNVTPSEVPRTSLDLPQAPSQPPPTELNPVSPVALPHGKSPTAPQAVPLQQPNLAGDSLRQQRELTPMAKTKPEKTVFEIDKVVHPTQPRKRPPPGRFKGMCAGMIALLGNHLLVQMANVAVNNPAAHVAMAGFNAVTETFDEVDHFSFAAVVSPKFKVKKGLDPDYPTYHQAMTRPDADEWKAAMDSEVNVLIGMNTWTLVPRTEATRLGKQVIKSTWAFRQKRDPSGAPTKKKARFCVRGDLQSKCEEFESYSPVVQWSTVRLMLILSIVHGLETRQVDYVNAFAQADLDKDVFIEIPEGYDHNNDIDCVLKLNKSLHGMSDAPLMFFELLKKNLLSLDFQQLSHIDPCLFVHKHAICLTYVDDCLWFGKDGPALDALIKEMQGKMDLKVESRDVSAFLGIQFTRRGDTIELKQLGLIDKIIEATGMQDCNPKTTPADSKPLGKDKNGKPFNEQWGYASVVGMLLHLSGNSRPDLAFAVNQAARFTHDPKDSHATAIKRIVKYLKGTRDKGLIFKPSTDWKLDCHVDADFCGLWGSEDPNDPIVAKSRTGYIITLAGCPLVWKSTLQQETSLSTMMAECVALSTSMRELLPLKRLVKTIAKVVTGDDTVQVTTKSDVFEDNNGALACATLPRITPQSKFFAVKLHFFKEHVRNEQNPNGEVCIHKIDTLNQLADIMTKGLTQDKFEPLRDRLMGWDLVPASTDLPSNLHSRGSVENVRSVLRKPTIGKAVQFKV